MYHALLTNRYLTSRVIPLIAVAAVALCVALVIIVVSVMTGFLDMVRSSGRVLMGDVVVSYPVAGIPYYERLIEHINRLPEAAAATPVVDSWGLLRMPYPDGPNKQIETVQIWGIEPSFADVTGYADTLYWKQLTDEQWNRLYSDLIGQHWQQTRDALSQEQRLNLLREIVMLEDSDPQDVPSDEALAEHLARMSDAQWERLFDVLRFEPQLLEKIMTQQQWHELLSHDPRLLDRNLILQQGLSLPTGARPGIVMGMHVSVGNDRQKDGSYQPKQFGYWWMPRFEVTLTTLPITGGSVSGSDVESRIFQVVNEFVSGVFLIDDKRVMVPLEIAQEMLRLNEAEVVDPDDPTKVLGVDPARATMVLVRAKEGVSPIELRDAVRKAYDAFVMELADDPNAVVQPPLRGDREIGGAAVLTWEQQQAQFIGPVEKERSLMRILFSIVYVVCAGLVLAIFWAIVHEKTRDIGILRSIGASRLGVSWIFLRYGLVVGILGAIVGLGLGALIVHHINDIHDVLDEPPAWLHVSILAAAGLVLIFTIVRSFTGRLLPLVLGGLITIALAAVGTGALLLHMIGGFTMWNPEVYYFTEIPNTLDVNSAILTMIGAVVFSLIGAFIPAAKAADTDPVQALRYE